MPSWCSPSMVRALVYRPRIILPHHVRAFAGFTVQPLALRHPLLFKPPVRMMPFPVGPGKQIPVWQGQAPAYADDSPSAAEAVNSLVLAMQLATQGPYGEKYWDTEAVKDGIESAIEAANAAGADPEKLRMAREVLAQKALPRKPDRFW